MYSKALYDAARTDAHHSYREPYAYFWREHSKLNVSDNPGQGLPHPFGAIPYPFKRHEELKRKREAGGDELDLMLHEEGESMVVDFVDQPGPFPRTAWACILADSNTKMYFFGANMYLLSTFDGGSTEGALLKGPNAICSTWRALRKAEFGSIDAIIRHPSRDNEAYVFSFDEYAIISFTSDTDSSLVMAQD